MYLDQLTIKVHNSNYFRTTFGKCRNSRRPTLVTPKEYMQPNIKGIIKDIITTTAGAQLVETFPEWEALVRTALNVKVPPVFWLGNDVSENGPLNYLQTNILIDGEQVEPADFEKVNTVGDGTCLVHAYLTSTSALYRAIAYNEKSAVGMKVRSLLNIPGSGSDWLGDEYIEQLNQVAKTQLLYINKVPGQNMARVVSPANADGPFIMIVNEGNRHYSSVTFKGKYVVDTVFVYFDDA